MIRYMFSLLGSKRESPDSLDSAQNYSYNPALRFGLLTADFRLPRADRKTLRELDLPEFSAAMSAINPLSLD